MNAEDLRKKAKLIRQLLAQAESEKALGNLAAAESFAAKVSQLCDKYRLSVAELPEEDLRDTIREGRWSMDDIGERNRYQRSHWLTTLSYGVAFGHRCACLNFRGFSMVGFVGLEQDVEVCRAMMSILTRAAKASFVNYKTEHKGAKVRPYMSGFALAIVRRYKVQREESERNENAMALMRIVDQLIEKAVAEVKADRHKYAAPRATDDFKQGVADGNRQDLRARLLSEDHKTQPLLLAEGGAQ